MVLFSHPSEQPLVRQANTNKAAHFRISKS
jgi:hypothetical protein